MKDKKGWIRVASTSERLREALEAKDMKQAELAKASGVDRGSIHHYLNGRYEPKSGAINKMASALGVDEMWLWGYDVPMVKKKISPEKQELSGGEEVLLELFRAIPEERQELVLQMIRVALGQKKQ